MIRKFWFGLIILLLAACLPSPTSTTQTGATIPVSLSTESSLATLTVESTNDRTQEPTQPCGYQWARQPLPEVSQHIQNLFDEVGLFEVILRAEAFGENCLNPDMSVQRFLPMQTDLYLGIPVSDLDPETLGTWLEKTLPILEQVSPESLPGPMSSSAYITYEFSAGDEKLTLRLQRPQAFQPLDEGKRGVALYQALMP
ncbi:MAG TPA: hypothetical protein VN452_08830 [Longilinea sp.]|nr:hypothetical protein [Longilinea sp.]